MSVLLDKYFKISVVKVLAKLKEDTEKIKRVFFNHENINKIKIKKAIVELKSKIIEKENSLKGIKSRFK